MKTEKYTYKSDRRELLYVNIMINDWTWPSIAVDPSHGAEASGGYHKYIHPAKLKYVTRR
jgi:hypothetical protein